MTQLVAHILILLVHKQSHKSLSYDANAILLILLVFLCIYIGLKMSISP